MKTLCLLLSLASPAFAGSILFGESWDGNPPGTIGDLSVGDYNAGAPDFAKGVYRITVDGGFSALIDQDVIGFEGDSFCAQAATPCTLQHAYVANGQRVSTVLEVYMDRPWHLTGWSPNFGKVTSNGPQFAIAQSGPNSWTWGFEDLRAGDNDFQDLYGRITYLRSGEPTPMPTPPATPVPETRTDLLLGFGLAGLAFVRLRESWRVL